MKRLVCFLVLCACALPAAAATVWREKSLYTASTQLAAGDVVVVAVEDITNLRFTMNVESKSASDISSNPDATITGFLPKVSADKKSTTADSSSLQGKGNINIEIAARITARTAEGKYQVEGIKEYLFNGVSTRFEVSGIVDPALMSGRSIRSTDIVNFLLTVSGTKQGLGLNIQRPPLKENDTPNADLTDAEKQRIIIDYLTKMLSELSR
ncbi:MAG: flagellar basal body L-ring protein FlgH [Spirochaetota bacterium]